MKRLVLFLLISWFCQSCEKVEFSMNKSPYWGNDLRLNGYYYNNDESYTDIIYLYRDGTLANCAINKQGNVDKIDETLIDFQNDSQFKYRINWGCFSIGADNIQYEYKGTTGCFYFISQFRGIIQNETTFIISEYKEKNTDKKFKEIFKTYLFREFSHKPDSSLYKK